LAQDWRKIMLNNNATDAALLDLLARAPQGLRIAEIAAQTNSWPLVPSRRSLQRFLKALADQGRVSVSGETSARIYRLANTTIRDDGWSRATNLLALSSTASELQRLVNQSLTLRQPIAYQCQFLDAYQPNQSAYLAPAVRSHLQHIGSTSAGERPAGTHARAIYNRLFWSIWPGHRRASKAIPTRGSIPKR